MMITHLLQERKLKFFFPQHPDYERAREWRENKWKERKTIFQKHTHLSSCYIVCPFETEEKSRKNSNLSIWKPREIERERERRARNLIEVLHTGKETIISRFHSLSLFLYSSVFLQSREREREEERKKDELNV